MAKKSIQHYEDTCPYCGSRNICLIDSRAEAYIGWYSEDIECEDCHKRWTEIYELEYAETIIEEKEEINES